MDTVLLYIAAACSLIAIVFLMAKPLWGVMAIFLLRPIVDTTWAQPIFSDLKLTEIVSSAVPLIVFARMLIDDGSRRPFSDMPLKWIWVLWSIDIVLFSSSIMFSQGWLEGLQVLMRHLNGVVGFYMIQAYCKNDQDFRRFAWVLAIAGLFPMATGVLEGVTGVHWKVTLGENNVVRNIGLYHDAITIRYYALQTIMGLLLIVVLGKQRSILLKILCIVYGLAAVFVLKGAYSKAGFLILGGWIVLWPILRRDVKTLAFVAIGAIVVALYYSREIMASMGFVFVKEIAAINGQAGVERTFAGRWYLWADLLNEWQALGPVAKLLGAGHIASGAHNDYLQILFHGGLVGLGIYVVLLVAIGGKIACMLLQKSDIWATAALFTFIMWIVDTIGLVPSAYSGYQWFVWGIIGFCLRRRQSEVAPLSSDLQPRLVPRFENLLGAA